MSSANQTVQLTDSLVTRMRMAAYKVGRLFVDRTQRASKALPVAETPKEVSDLTTALRDHRPMFWVIFGFSVPVNLLMLTGSVFMLLVYDKVLTSGSLPTLLALLLLVVVLYFFMWIFDYVRSRVGAKIGARLLAQLERRVFQANLRHSLADSERSKPASGSKDLEAIARFMSSPVLLALCDVPWVVFYITLIYLFHPALGHLALGGGIFLVGVSLLNVRHTRRPETAAHVAALKSEKFAETVRRESELVKALGMVDSVTDRWLEKRAHASSAQYATGALSNLYSTASKVSRLLLQSLMLGLGAYLVLRGEVTASVMIVASILLGRALAPVEQTIGGWPLVQRALQGRTNVKKLLERESCETKDRTELPRPRGLVEVKNITLAPLGQRVVTLHQVSCTIKPGQALGVIGPSASGKSSLARALVNIWPPFSGTVCLDGAPLAQYDNEVLGSYIGYLPQDIVLFDGTVAENIARMKVSYDDAEVVAAAKKAGIHEMILSLPSGYDTLVSAAGAGLSGGQKQRIALARALYGDPVLLVLDEPNSNLDRAGQAALNTAIKQAKAAGQAVVLTAHQEAGIKECEQILILKEGRVLDYGNKKQLLEKHTAKKPADPVQRVSEIAS